VRQLGILLTAAVCLLGGTSINLTADAAASTRTARVAGHRSHGAPKARPACGAVPAPTPRGSHRVCQASVRGLHRTRAPQRRPGADGPKSTNAPPPSAAAAGKARAAVIAAILATQCQNTETAPEAGNLGLIRAAILCLVNRVRAQNGESPLLLSGALERAAEGHSRELISADYFAHVSPTGMTPVDRIRATGYIPGPSVGYVIGENLAWGTYGLATPQSIVSAWVASPGHLANILESQYRETGIGITPQVPRSLGGGSPGATYAQEFGVVIH
jgi:uncharacterized protein YkwD